MQQQPPQGVYVQIKRSGAATASLIFSFLGMIPLFFLFSILGIILGIVGAVSVSNSNGLKRGKGMAIAGIMIGLIGLLLWPALFIGGYYYMEDQAQEPLRVVEKFQKALDRGDDIAAYNMLSSELRSDVPLTAYKIASQKYRAKHGKYIATNSDLWEGNFMVAGDFFADSDGIAFFLLTTEYSKTGKGRQMFMLEKTGNKWKIIYASMMTDQQFRP